MECIKNATYLVASLVPEAGSESLSFRSANLQQDSPYALDPVTPKK